MKKLKIILIVACLVVSLALLCSCGKSLEDKIESFNKFTTKATKVTKSVVVTDGGVVVYQLDSTSEINGDKASVTTTQKTLGTNFALQEETKTSTSTKDQATNLLAFAEEDFLISTVQEDGFTCFVAAEKINSVLKTQGLQVGGDSTIVVNQQKTQVTVTCTFTTVSGKAVTISYQFYK